MTLRDAFGNAATGYRGTVRFTSTDPAAVLPADYTFTAADNGARSFPVTLNRVGERELRVQDTAVATLAASITVTVSQGPVSQFVLTAPPGPFVAGQGFTVEVLAQDSVGNEATGYRGTVRFTSQDPYAGLPASYTFTAADNGRRSFNVVLHTAANPQQITVTDLTVPSLAGTLGREIVPAPPPFAPCADVTCEVPEPTCAADGRTYVTFTSACVGVDDLPTCQDPETRMTCPGAEGVCFGSACGTADRPAEGELAITEVMHSPSEGTTDYVELHNRVQAVRNITGLQLELVVSGTVTHFTVESPRPRGRRAPRPRRVVRPRAARRVRRQRGRPCRRHLGDTFDLPAEGQLILKTASGTVIQDLTWSSSFPQTPGRSMNLASSMMGAQAQGEPQSWCDSSDRVRLMGGDYGTPGQPNESCGLSGSSPP